MREFMAGVFFAFFLSVVEAYFNKNSDEDDRNKQLLAQAKTLRRALIDLVYFKNYKDAFGKDEYYKENQPGAWVNAREAIANTRSIMK